MSSSTVVLPQCTSMMRQDRCLCMIMDLFIHHHCVVPESLPGGEGSQGQMPGKKKKKKKKDLIPDTTYIRRSINSGLIS